MSKTHTPQLDMATLRELAVIASTDPRTIKKILAGKPVRGLPAHRARRVLVEKGYLPASIGESQPKRQP